MGRVVLQVLPSGLVVPPLPHLLALLVGLVAVAGALYRVRPGVTDRTVVAFTPWMVAGAALHVLEQAGAAPAAVVPLLAAPAVYATTFVFAGGVWAAATAATDRSERVLEATGVVVAIVVVGAVLRVGTADATLRPVYPVVGLAASGVLAVTAYWLLGRVDPSVPARVGAAGPVVVFGHALDGVSTAVGVDLLGVGERSPLPAAIMDFAGALPTASVLGSGWLFVVVKLGIGVGVLVLFADFADAEPKQANALLGVVAAVGLGPGAHNLLLFTVAGAV